MAKITIEFDERSEGPIVRSSEAVAEAAVAGAGGDGGAAPAFDAASAVPRFDTIGVLDFDISDLMHQRGEGINAGEPPAWLFAALEGRTLDREILLDRQLLDLTPAPGFDTPVTDGGAAPENA